MGRLMNNMPLLLVALLVVVTAEGADGHDVVARVEGEVAVRCLPATYILSLRKQSPWKDSCIADSCPLFCSGFGRGNGRDEGILGRAGC